MYVKSRFDCKIFYQNIFYLTEIQNKNIFNSTSTSVATSNDGINEEQPLLPTRGYTSIKFEEDNENLIKEEEVNVPNIFSPLNEKEEEEKYNKNNNKSDCNTEEQTGNGHENINDLNGGNEHFGRAKYRCVFRGNLYF